MRAFLERSSSDSGKGLVISRVLDGWLRVARRGVGASLILLAFLKLALVSNQDIVAWYRPHDDYWQIVSASHWVWWRPNSEWTLMHLPVYPVFVAVTGAIGLPLRLAIELLYIGGAAALALAFGRLGLPKLLQVILFGLIVFHPYSYAGFDYAFAETLYACLMLFFVAFFIRIIAPRSRFDVILSATLFAGTTALMWHCRKESILLEGLLSLIGLAVVAGFVLRSLSKSNAVRLGVALVAAPAVAVVVLGSLISTANGLRYGLWHTNQMTAPNYVRAYSSLQAIHPEHPIRFIPVTRASRQKAYAVSPAFRELAPFIDGEHENWGGSFTRQYLGIDGEIGAGWFYWVLIDAAAQAGHFKNAQEAEAFFGRVANEITAALDDGRLPRRSVFLPFVDPSLSIWLPHLLASTTKLARQLFPASAPIRGVSQPEVSPKVAADFDRVANRRASASKPPSYVAQGWALSSRLQPTGIQIVDAGGSAVRTAFQAQSRPDVPGVPDETGKPGPPALGFVIDWPSAGYSLETIRMKVLLERSKFAFSPLLSELPLGHAVSLTIPDGDQTVLLALDRLDRPITTKREMIVAYVIAWYPLVLGTFGILAISRLVFVVFSRKRPSMMAPLVVAMFLLCIIISRLLFFAVLDASAWSGEQTRYLVPIAILVVAVPALLFSFGRVPPTLRPRATGAS
jgi:hypothetical protein